MTWVAELQVIWIVDGKRVPGGVAIGVPELVPGRDDSEATCAIALDGLQPVTNVHGIGTFHALMQGVRFLHARLRDYVADGVRLTFPDSDDDDDPGDDTEFLLAMFKPFE
jgi:hypothetical protein